MTIKYQKSRDHVLFYHSEMNNTDYELYRDNGEWYHAPVSNVIDVTTKNRIGRWIGPKSWSIDKIKKYLGLNDDIILKEAVMNFKSKNETNGFYNEVYSNEGGTSTQNKKIADETFDAVANHLIKIFPKIFNKDNVVKFLDSQAGKHMADGILPASGEWSIHDVLDNIEDYLMKTVARGNKDELRKYVNEYTSWEESANVKFIVRNGKLLRTIQESNGQIRIIEDDEPMYKNPKNRSEVEKAHAYLMSRKAEMKPGDFESKYGKDFKKIEDFMKKYAEKDKEKGKETKSGGKPEKKPEGGDGKGAEESVETKVIVKEGRIILKEEIERKEFDSWDEWKQFAKDNGFEVFVDEVIVGKYYIKDENGNVIGEFNKAEDKGWIELPESSENDDEENKIKVIEDVIDMKNVIILSADWSEQDEMVKEFLNLVKKNKIPKNAEKFQELKEYLDSGSIDNIEEAISLIEDYLKSVHWYLYNDPESEGTDQANIIISRNRLSDKDVKKISNELWGIEESVKNRIIIKNGSIKLKEEGLPKEIAQWLDKQPDRFSESDVYERFGDEADDAIDLMLDNGAIEEIEIKNNDRQFKKHNNS